MKKKKKKRTTYIALTWYLSHLEMMWSPQEDVRRLYVNTPPFYLWDLSISGFVYLREVLKPVPCRYQGMTVHATQLHGSVPQASWDLTHFMVGTVFLMKFISKSQTVLDTWRAMFLN
jgi:hypothetical protein